MRKQKLMTYIAIAGTFAGISSCASAIANAMAPTQAELDALEYPAPPVDYKEKTEEVIKKTLKDPYSAKFDYMSEPTEFAIKQNGELTAGYLVRVWVNSKNSFGAYAGRTPYFLFFRGGQFVQFVDPATFVNPAGMN